MPDASLLLIQLTPPGRGAVASIRIEGPGARELVARHFITRSGRPLTDFPPGRIVLGQIRPRGEEVVLNQYSDRAIELHCHGGLAAVARLEEIFIGDGCRQVSWQEWTASQEADPFAAAARLALAEARTPITAAILLDQYQGALRKAMEQIETFLQAGEKEVAWQQIEALLSRGDTGLHLIRPWQVVVAGRPNVGKSSLINAIAGYQRAIVHSMPGTTRDVVGVQTAMGGWPVEVSDTAGLRETREEIEQAGIDLARKKILAADLIVLVRQLAGVVSAGSGPAGILSQGRRRVQQERLTQRHWVAATRHGNQREALDRDRRFVPGNCPSSGAATASTRCRRTV